MRMMWYRTLSVMIVVSVCVSITGPGIHSEITGTADDTFSYCKEDFLADYDMLWEMDEIRSARRWVIVDGRVYSAADSFSAFCRETGLLIRFSGLAVESPDSALNAIIGTRPDVQIGMDDGNAYDVICKVIEEGSK